MENCTNPSSPARYTPPDVLVDLPGWLARAEKLAAATGLPGLDGELAAIRTAIGRPGCTVVVVGEFGRGKSTLVARVLDRPQPLPAPPGPARPVAIAAGDQDCLEVPGPDGVERWPLDGARPDRPVSPAPADQTGRVLLRHPLLAELDLTLVDVPGTNSDPVGDEARLRRLVAGADAAVMVVGADAALSASEMALLRDVVLGADVPHVLLAVSMLDRVDPAEHERVLARVRRKVAALDPAVTVCPLATGADGVDPVEAVRAWLRTVADPAQRRRWRGVQLAGQLTGVLRRLVEAAGAGADAAERSAEERAELIRQARQDLDGELLVFGEYRIELRRRQAQVARQFREQLATARDAVLESLRYELRRSGNPAVWWQRDMPHQLRRELAAVAHRHEQGLRTATTTDLRWFQAEIAGRFGSDSRPVPAGPFTPGQGTYLLAPEQDELPFPHLGRRKLAYRLGPTAVALAGVLLVPGVGPIAMISASIAGTLLTEVKLRADVEEQRTAVVRRLDSLVDRTVEEFADTVSQRLGALYDDLLERTTQVRRDWYDRRVRAIESSHAENPGGPPVPDWSELAGQADELLTTVVRALRPAAEGTTITTGEDER